jgi:Uma2 family endonuclease
MTTASVSPDRRMTVAAFLAWSEDLPDEARYKLVDGVPIRLMAPTSIRHAQVRYNASHALRHAIAVVHAPCEALDAGPGVAVGHKGRECRIPDVVVTCAPEIDETARLVPEPVIVVEVASPSTRLADINGKVEFYGNIASIRTTS